MKKINQTKLKKYRTFQGDPALAIMRLAQDLEAKIENTLKEVEKRLTEQVKAIKEQIKGEVDPKMEQIVKNVLKDVKGDKGDSIKGDSGKDAYIPVKGKDYFDGKDGKTIIGPQGIPGKSIKGKDGKDAADAKTPIFGIDYFTKDQIKDIMSQIIGMIKLKPLEEQVKQILKKLDQMEKAQDHLGRRTIHRGGIDFVWNELVGTGDVAGTLTFDLDYVPYSDSELTVYVGGGIQFLADDYTRSGKTLTFITPPPLDAKIRATYRK